MTIKNALTVKVSKLNPEAKLPKYATDGSGCFDLFALMDIDTPRSVYLGIPVLIRTGLAFEIPQGHVMMVYSRSGHGFKNATRLANCTGIIDSDYRGELMLKLSKDSEYSDTLTVKNGDRIAQGMIVPIPKVQFVEAEELSETERGAGGFGSTGA